ncbi:MAG: PqqD family protein [Clostridia bacterium]|nr:PqqD family protein [Clostridia bacterium]
MKKNIIKKNYLEKIPVISDTIDWNTDEDGIVTISIENKGVFNKLAQKFLKKPKTSYVHLDEFGSSVWQLIDGQRNIIKIGELFSEKFGDKTNPLYERLAKYFQILDSYGFIKWN